MKSSYAQFTEEKTNLSNELCGIKIELALCADVKFEQLLFVLVVTAVLFIACVDKVFNELDIGTVLTVITLADVHNVVADGY